MKICTKCSAPKDESEYYAHKKTADGLNTWCKACIIIAVGNNKRRLKKIYPVKYYLLESKYNHDYYLGHDGQGREARNEERKNKRKNNWA